MKLGGSTRLVAPDPDTPFWRLPGGRRESYRSLRCHLDRRAAAELGAAHLEAIGRIAAAALSAAERGDQGETVRLASAAGRLCGEIRGHWPPSAVEGRKP